MTGYRIGSIPCKIKNLSQKEKVWGQMTGYRIGSIPCKTKNLSQKEKVFKQMTGIEPAYSAWEADVLPLNYICMI